MNFRPDNRNSPPSGRSAYYRQILTPNSAMRLLRRQRETFGANASYAANARMSEVVGNTNNLSVAPSGESGLADCKDGCFGDFNMWVLRTRDCAVLPTKPRIKN